MQCLPELMTKLDPSTSPVVQVQINEGSYSRQYLAIDPAGFLIWCPVGERYHTSDDADVCPINSAITTVKFSKSPDAVQLVRWTAPKSIDIIFEDNGTCHVVKTFIDNIMTYCANLSPSSRSGSSAR